MLQKLIYAKLTLNISVGEAVISDARRHKPPAGYVIMLVLTENQFSRMEIVTGEMKTNVLNTCDRVVLL